MSDNISNLAQSLAAITPDLQRFVEPLFKSECDRHVISTADIRCVVDLNVQYIRIESDRIPTIRLGAAFVFDSLANDPDSGSRLVRGLSKAVRLAHTRMRWTLSTPRQVYSLDYQPDVKAWKAAHPESVPSILPSAFRTSISITLTDPVSGITVTQDNVAPSNVSVVRAELHSLLASRIMVDAMAEEFYTALEATREMKILPPLSTDLHPRQDGTDIETIHYAGETSNHVE